MRLVTAREMKSIDRWAIEDAGIPGPVLMENAGVCVTRVISRIAGRVNGLRVAVLCGKGNNGGDGFVVARHLINKGADVRVFVAGGSAGIAGDALTNLNVLLKMGRQDCIAEAERATATADGGLGLDSYDIIVDALLGTGFTGEVREPVASAVRAINHARGRRAECLSTRPVVVAVDVPSGLDASTGRAAGCCVRADHTVTFAYPKMGLATCAGAEYAGEIIVADIGIPGGMGPAAGIRTELIEAEMVSGWIGSRLRDSHKGTYGSVLIVAGSSGMTGAAHLCAEAALRAGAGLVTVGVPGSLAGVMEAKLTEAMKLGLPETVQPNASAGPKVTLSREAILPVVEFCRGASVLAFGPGVSVNEDVRELTRGILAEVRVPVVIDADGLNCLSGPESLRSRVAPTVVTPHPGEMSRLAGVDVAGVQADRPGTALEFAARSGAVTVLKGAWTVVASPDGLMYVNPTGNPAMASGGMGDVLTGVIAALIGQGMEPLKAAAAGVYLHGLAGDIASRDIGPAGALAGDVACRVPEARDLVRRFRGCGPGGDDDISLKSLDTTGVLEHRHIAG